MTKLKKFESVIVKNPENDPFENDLSLIVSISRSVEAF
jgi:hypothetical protein